MEKERDAVSNVVNHYESGANCQVFNGSISGCVFAMPGSNGTNAVDYFAMLRGWTLCRGDC